MQARNQAVAIAALAACVAWQNINGESFSNLQSVDANGVSAWNATFPVTLTGVLLTDPGEMLDDTANLSPGTAAQAYMSWAGNGRCSFKLFFPVIEAGWNVGWRKTTGICHGNRMTEATAIRTPIGPGMFIVSAMIPPPDMLFARATW